MPRETRFGPVGLAAHSLLIQTCRATAAYLDRILEPVTALGRGSTQPEYPVAVGAVDQTAYRSLCQAGTTSFESDIVQTAISTAGAAIDASGHDETVKSSTCGNGRLRRRVELVAAESWLPTVSPAAAAFWSDAVNVPTADQTGLVPHQGCDLYEDSS